MPPIGYKQARHRWEIERFIGPQIPLKQRLELIWADKKVRSPSRIVIWISEPVGYREDQFLYWRHGKLSFPKWMRRKKIDYNRNR